MKEIQLKQGFVALVDDDVFNELNQYKWQVRKGRNTYYAQRSTPGTKTRILMHRQILGITEPKILVDHKDHNGLNNCKSNLRPATSQQNQANRGACIGTFSKHKGVYKFKCNKPSGSYEYWRAVIRKEGKQTLIGTFKSEQEAAEAYNKECLEIHGEFAYLNEV